MSIFSYVRTSSPLELLRSFVLYCFLSVWLPFISSVVLTLARSCMLSLHVPCVGFLYVCMSSLLAGVLFISFVRFFFISLRGYVFRSPLFVVR